MLMKLRDEQGKPLIAWRLPLARLPLPVTACKEVRKVTLNPRLGIRLTPGTYSEHILKALPPDVDATSYNMYLLSATCTPLRAQRPLRGTNRDFYPRSVRPPTCDDG